MCFSKQVLHTDIAVQWHVKICQKKKKTCKGSVFSFIRKRGKNPELLTKNKAIYSTDMFQHSPRAKIHSCATHWLLWVLTSIIITADIYSRITDFWMSHTQILLYFFPTVTPEIFICISVAMEKWTFRKAGRIMSLRKSPIVGNRENIGWKHIHTTANITEKCQLR